MKAVEVFECNLCNNTYYTFSKASMCCPDVDEKWECSECGDIFDFQEEAEICCVKKEDEEKK